MSRRKQQWRVQVDHYPAKGSKISEARWLIESHPKGRDVTSQWIPLPGTEVDEIVIDTWFHLEQLGGRSYWMDIGGLRVDVQVGKSGRPEHIRWEIDQRVDGCEYEAGP